MASEDSLTNTPKKLKLYSRAEVAKHKDCKDTWIIIHNKVYNITEFLNEHPGGEEILLEQAGDDGTESFEDIGHSTDARELMHSYLIGEIVEDEQIEPDDKKSNNWANENSADSDPSSWKSWLIPVALGVLVTLAYRYFISTN